VQLWCCTGTVRQGTLRMHLQTKEQHTIVMIHSQSVPNTKSHPFTSTLLVGFTPPTSFRTPLATWMSSNHTQLDPLDLSLSHPNPRSKPQSEQPSMASETEWPSKIMWSSHDNHATTLHLCHLIGRPASQQTWDLRVPTPLFFRSISILLHANAA